MERVGNLLGQIASLKRATLKQSAGGGSGGAAAAESAAPRTAPVRPPTEAQRSVAHPRTAVQPPLQRQPHAPPSAQQKQPNPRNSNSTPQPGLAVVTGASTREPSGAGSGANLQGGRPAARARPLQDDPPPVRRRRAGASSELTLIKGILSKALAQKGLERKLERYEFVLHWTEIVGEHAAQVARPECIVNRALIVRVANSVWAQELAFMKPVILQRLTPYLRSGDIVTDIIFRVGRV